MLSQQELKQQAADAALEFVEQVAGPDVIIGVGTGSTADLFIDGLARFKGRIGGTPSRGKTARGLHRTLTNSWRPGAASVASGTNAYGRRVLRRGRAAPRLRRRPREAQASADFTLST